MVTWWWLLLACGPGPAGDGSASASVSQLSSDDSAPAGASIDTAGVPGTDSGRDTGPATEPGVPARGSEGCGGPVPTSPYDLQLTSGGRVRDAIVDLPGAYDGTAPVPLVLNFHGAATTADMHRGYTDMHLAATGRGWISVHPDGLQRTWDYLSESPDVVFVRQLLDELEQNLCIDTSRIYATGLSNGGYFSYQLACDLAPRLTAIAAVAAGDVTLGCRPGVVVPLLHLHGTDDNVVPYDGSPWLKGAEESVAGWAQRVNECPADPVPGFATGDVHCDVWSCGPTDEATLCTIDGGGHTWPGGYPIPLLGSTNDDIDASESILDFFARWARP